MRRIVLTTMLLALLAPLMFDTVGIPRCLSCPSCRWSPTIRVLVAQDAGKDAATEAKALPRELELEEQIIQLEARVVSLEGQNKALNLSLFGAKQALEAKLNAEMKADLDPVNAKAAEWERRAVAALGGDYEKGDRYDRQAKALKKAAEAPVATDAIETRPTTPK